MQALGQARRRTGALTWGLFQDTADSDRWLEVFTVESWLQHRRQHDRVSVSDRRLQEAAQALHTDAAPPRVRHFVAPAAGR
jgi:hypothetical protein